MRTILAVAASLLLLQPFAAHALDSKAALEGVAKALGADIVTSVVYTGSGTQFAVGQSFTPGESWPKFGAKRRCPGASRQPPSSTTRT
jgi:hypothetical protein